MAECPTQHWMKATLQAYLRTHDYKRLEASFEELASHAPAGYERWQEMAQQGASAASRHDEGEVRKACQSCHDQHRTTFRREMRSAPLW
jgi:cytochrome c556